MVLYRFLHIFNQKSISMHGFPKVSTWVFVCMSSLHSSYRAKFVKCNLQVFFVFICADIQKIIQTVNIMTNWIFKNSKPEILGWERLNYTPRHTETRLILRLIYSQVRCKQFRTVDRKGKQCICCMAMGGRGVSVVRSQYYYWNSTSTLE